MNKKDILSLAKKMIAGVLAIGMLVAGIIIAPKQADATEIVDLTGKVVCEEYAKTDIEKYWTVDNKTAPLKAGYVFGGWFKKTNESVDKAETLTLTDGNTINCVPLTENEMAEAMPDSAYAKFVPAQVLSVKAQNQDGVNADYIANLNKDWVEGEEKDSFWVRVMTSLDSMNYEKIGFDIYLANKKHLTKPDGSALETTKIYAGVLEGGEVRQASDIFGTPSNYVCVWKLDKIDTPSNANKIIYVRPYWYTTDGTKVVGLAKYVHIEDEYMNYISVPVNLLGGEQVAAGAVNMTYTNANVGETVALTFKEVEAGRMLPEMKSKESGNMIKIVGNAKTAGEYNSTETLYANVRFIKPTDAADVDVNFAMDMVQFCDWDEADVKINEKWDVKYDVK